LTEIPPASWKTIPVDRVGIREHVALDEHVGGVERIDEGPHRLSPCTAFEGEQRRTKEAENNY